MFILSTDCIKRNKYDDFCSKKTESYMGKYHIGYKFKTDNTRLPMVNIIFFILMIIPALFTKAKILSIIWGLFIGLIYIIF